MPHTASELEVSKPLTSRVWQWLTGRSPHRVPPLHAFDSELLALVASRTTNTVIITNRYGRILWVNEGFTRLTGYRFDEAEGRQPSELLQGPATDKATVLAMRHHLGRGEGFRAELLNYTKGKKPYWISIECQPVHDADGKIRYFVAIENDITQQKNAEEALKRAEEQYRGIFENAVMGIFQTTADGQYLVVNQALAKIYGHDSALDLKNSVTDIERQLYVDPSCGTISSP